MADFVLTATHDVSLSPDDVLGLFGSRAAISWLFDVQCDAVRVGSPVTLVLPAGSLGHDPVAVLGRISRIVPGKSIEIVHDQPWQGMLKILVRPNSSGGSSVTVLGKVDQRGLEWVMQRRGWPLRAKGNDSTHRIGLLISKSGPAAVFTVAMEYMAELAVEELNAEGGIHGRPIEVVVADDATNKDQAILESRQLLAIGSRAVITSVTSASFAAVQNTLASTGRPLIHTVVNEGGNGSESVMRWGERPLAQVRTAAGSVMEAAGGKRWYMIGNDYQWPRGAHRAAARALSEVGAQIVGNEFVPVGTVDFTSTLERIERSGADCVLSTLIGADEIAFERQTWAAGLRSKWQTLSLVLEESSRERIGDAAAQGIWTALGYYEDLATPENKVLVERYRSRYGKWAPPLSSLSESIYEAIMLYAAAARSSASGDSSVIRNLRQIAGRMPRGAVAAKGPHMMQQDLYLARAGNGGFDIVNG
ncbi:ABC transporter substrate-binding protein [Rhodococcus pyridinivorans]|uniref:ABC transporter substrate-binding protein n=1 Tax=Rhodococcus pyridinivorans TaxID=103816 RepID=UPI0020791228|nr:ABC transporter substrate-binding protein [Rhodococcus pyridinivorans]USI93093.1 ABC transporter substrate-binding protein [Rhodococcus pyridinivorans]